MPKTIQQRLIEKLRKLNAFLENSVENEEIIAHFIEKYIVCEICYKALLLSYRTENQKETAESTLTVNIQEAQKVLRFYNYEFDESVVERLFSSESHKGIRSSRTLRNLILHKLSESAILEVVQRSQELHQDMDLFLTLFNNNDI